MSLVWCCKKTNLSLKARHRNKSILIENIIGSTRQNRVEPALDKFAELVANTQNRATEAKLWMQRVSKKNGLPKQAARKNLNSSLSKADGSKGLGSRAIFVQDFHEENAGGPIGGLFDFQGFLPRRD